MSNVQQFKRTLKNQRYNNDNTSSERRKIFLVSRWKDNSSVVKHWKSFSNILFLYSDFTDSILFQIKLAVSMVEFERLTIYTTVCSNKTSLNGSRSAINLARRLVNLDKEWTNRRNETQRKKMKEFGEERREKKKKGINKEK